MKTHTLTLLSALCTFTACDTSTVMNPLKGISHATCDWEETRFDPQSGDNITHFYKDLNTEVRIETKDLRFVITALTEAVTAEQTTVFLSLTSYFTPGEKMTVFPSTAYETRTHLAFGAEWAFAFLDCPSNNETQCRIVRWPGSLVYRSPRSGSEKPKLARLAGAMSRDLDPSDPLKFRSYQCRWPE